MKPYVICRLIASPDVGLHPSGFTTSPQGGRLEHGPLHLRCDDAIVVRTAGVEPAQP